MASLVLVVWLTVQWPSKVKCDYQNYRVVISGSREGCEHKTAPPHTHTLECVDEQTPTTLRCVPWHWSCRGKRLVIRPSNHWSHNVTAPTMANKSRWKKSFLKMTSNEGHGRRSASACPAVGNSKPNLIGGNEFSQLKQCSCCCGVLSAWRSWGTDLSGLSAAQPPTVTDNPLSLDQQIIPWDWSSVRRDA